MAKILSFIPNITKLFQSQSARKDRSQPEHKNQLRLKAVFLIVDWNKVYAVSEVFEKEPSLLTFVSKGSGTANSEILDILGIGATDKAVFLCIAPSTDTHRLIQAVRHKMGAQSAGAGIAFTVPFSGINISIMKIFLDALAENTEAGKKLIDTHKEKAMKSIEIKNDLILSILNQGYSDAFMSAARKAGARGGTVISARGISEQVAKKFVGISLQEEKEIILILANSEQKVAIMRAVSTEFGVSTKAAGLIFSLPVDHVSSLNELTS
jgi:nitrogen regulatory protein PII